MDAGERTALWLWIVLVIVAPVIAILTFGVQVGRCEDPHPGSDAGSCALGPAVGMPGAILIAAVCVALFTLAVIRIVLLSLRRAGVR
ncbi:hypothetical protein MIAR_24240 [Microbacterium arabinogalactanolyticum]|nr:hypothetical protein MIAR_24240 [Microbacterium arabinogalactanolyticum]